MRKDILFLVVSMLLLSAVNAWAQTEKRRGGMNLESFLKSDLDVILNTPLKGESQHTAGISPEASENLLGKIVVAFEAVSPPRGFDPVRDLGMESGIVMTRALARQMVLRLWETGKYRNIRILGRTNNDNGVIVMIRVEPMFRIARFVFSGNEALDDSEIKRAIGFSTGGTIVPENDAMIVIRDRLLREYGKRGYNEATAAVRLETTANVSELALLIDVEEGTPDEYDVVHIKGLNEQVTEEQLLRASGLKRGIIRDDESVKEGLRKIEQTLFELGFPDAQIPDDYSEVKIGQNRYALRIRVDLGLKTLLAFEGNEKLRKRELRELIWKQGYHSDARGVKKSITQLNAYALSKGLFHTRVSVFRRCYANEDRWYDVSVNEQCRRRAVQWQTISYLVEEGPQVEVVDVIIHGASYFGLNYLRDEVLAFMAEQNRTEGGFEDFSTRALNETVAASSADMAKGRPRGVGSVYEKPESIYETEKYLEVTRHLEDLYAEQGFLNAEVVDTCITAAQNPIVRERETFFPTSCARDREGKNAGKETPCLFISDDKTQLIVSISIKEGIQTLISSIEIDGNTASVFSFDALLAVGKLAVGQPFNEYFVRDASDFMLKAYQEKGYMFANVTWQTELSEDRTSAKVIVRVDEGPEVRVNNIQVNSDITNRWFIRDNLGFESGDLVTPSLLNDARQRVMDMGIFNSATVQMQSPGTIGNRKNIVVTVVERKSQYLELRAGAATEEGIRGGFEYGHRNISGLAINYRLKVRANYRPERYWFMGNGAIDYRDDLHQRYADYNATHNDISEFFQRFEWYFLTGFRTSNIPGTSGVLGTGLDVTFENVNRIGFSAFKITPRYRLTSHYLKQLPIELYTGLDGTILLTTTNDGTSGVQGSSYARLPSGQAVFWVTGLSLSLDYRDNPLAPREGVFLALRGDYVHSIDRYTEPQDNGAIKKSRYIRFAGSLSAYFPILNKDNVLALSTTVGYIFHLIQNSIAWADRYFYMGGVSTLRGFPSDTLRPEDLRPTYDDILFDADGNERTPTYDLLTEYGGEAMFLIRAELRHDFGNNIGGVLFGEAGNIWRNADNFMVNSKFESSRLLLRPTAGAGIHYNTPVGPLSFDVGVNLDRNQSLKKNKKTTTSQEELWAWYFSIGNAF